MRAAAFHCIKLDESGDFPVHHALGLFEVAPATDELSALPPPSGKSLVVSAAQVDFAVRRRKKGHSDARLPGSLGVSVLLEVEVDRETSSTLQQTVSPPSPASAGSSGSGIDAATSGHSGAAAESPHASIPKRGDVEAAAAAAAAAVADRAGAQAAISALACWNLMMTWEAAVPTAVLVEISAAFGNHGDWYTISKTIPLTQSSSDHGSSSPSGLPPSSPSSWSSNLNQDATSRPTLLSTSFDWKPTGVVWDKLDDFAVADVKVYDAAHIDMIGASSSSLSAMLLTQVTLCKRASADIGGGGGMGSEEGPAIVRAELTPYAEQQPHARRTSRSSTLIGGAPPELVSIIPSEAVPNLSSSLPPGAVSEIDDQEWWINREEDERSRGMQAVHRLPRLSGWKPGQWRVRRQRRRKQEEERELRRAREAKARRERSRAGRGDAGGAGGGRRKTGSNRRGPGMGVVKRLWRAVGKEWERVRRRFRRLKRTE